MKQKPLVTLLVCFVSGGCHSQPIVARASMQVAKAALMSGFLRARSQELIGPVAGTDWSFKVMMLAPEGSRVKAGDLVAVFEGEQLAENERNNETNRMERRVELQGELENARAELKTLESTVAQEEKELELLKVTASKGGNDVIADWTVSERQHLLDRLDVEARSIKLRIDHDKLARKRQMIKEVSLSMAEAEAFGAAKAAYFKKAHEDGKRFAHMSGLVVYERGRGDQKKPRMGEEVYGGSTALAVVDDANLYVEGYLKEERIHDVKVGDPVLVRVLGRREVTVPGTIAKISRVVMKARDWNAALPDTHPLADARVFCVEVSLAHQPEEARPAGEVEIEAKDGV